MSAFEIALPIRFGDIDHARILYYPKFYHYFHQAFEEIYPVRLGQHYHEVLDHDKVGFPAVHQEVDFVSPVRYGETVLIQIFLEKLGEKSVTLHFEMTDQKTNQLRARCQMVLACLDMTSYQAIPFPEKYRQLFEGLTKE